MRIRILPIGLLFALCPHGRLDAQVTGTPINGWYNGDCQFTGAGGWSNWYMSDQQFTRVYDGFTVPDGGWNIVGVFSNDQLSNAPPITQAAWEIRSGVSDRSAGTVVAAGVGAATQTIVSSGTWRIEVDGLTLTLAPGQYWLNVSPVGVSFRQSYVCETTGGSGFGDTPAGGSAYYTQDGTSFHGMFSPAGVDLHFSHGVIIQPPALTPAGAWQSDLAYLVQQMPRMHSVPYPGVSLDDFHAAAAQLSTQVPSLSTAEIRTGFEMLVASINDPHTTVGWSPFPYRYLPLTLYWFDEGVFVTGAVPAYRNLLGGRVVAIGKVGIDEAIARLTPLIAHDNDQWIRQSMPSNKLVNTDFLFATGITDDNVNAAVQVELPSGEKQSAMVQPGGGPQSDVYQGTLPLYRRHPERNYWAATIDEGETVYFQYNRCMEDPVQPYAEFQQQLDDLLAQDGVQRLIVDMRNNSGGFAFLDSWIAKIAASRFNDPKRLFVIVGRATFSAAMEAADLFRDTTSATFVGEPTGAKPRFLLRRGDFPLPYYGVRVSYSYGQERAKEDGAALVPDIQTPVRFADYMNGADPALDAIRSIPLPEGK